MHAATVWTELLHCDGGIGIIINIESPEWGTDADADTCAALAVP